VEECQPYGTGLSCQFLVGAEASVWSLVNRHRINYSKHRQITATQSAQTLLRLYQHTLRTSFLLLENYKPVSSTTHENVSSCLSNTTNHTYLRQSRFSHTRPRFLFNMPILRNPFRKEHTLEENVRPLSQNKADPSAGFQNVELNGAKPVKPVNAKPVEPTEYQLSGKPPSNQVVASFHN